MKGGATRSDVAMLRAVANGLRQDSKTQCAQRLEAIANRIEFSLDEDDE